MKKSNEHLDEINNNTKYINEQEDKISNLKNEIEKMTTTYQVTISKYENFIANLMKIIEDKGYEMENQNEQFNEIFEIIKIILPIKDDKV